MDVIKKSVLEQFSSSISVSEMCFSLITAFVIALFIVYVYKKTFVGVVYNRSIVLTIVMISLATAMIIRTINSNLSLSLGMVGALSIVRFRTAIKEPVDTVFLFWAITAGIMSGAGLYLIAIIASLIVALCYYLSFFITTKAKSRYLLVVNYNKDATEQVEEILASITKKKLKSKSAVGNNKELTYEVSDEKEIMEKMDALQEISGVTVNLVSYNNEFGM